MFPILVQPVGHVALGHDDFFRKKTFYTWEKKKRGLSLYSQIKIMVLSLILILLQIMAHTNVKRDKAGLHYDYNH